MVLHHREDDDHDRDRHLRGREFEPMGGGWLGMGHTECGGGATGGADQTVRTWGVMGTPKSGHDATRTTIMETAAA